MKDLAFLWARRERPGTCRRWVVVWVKRFLQIPALARLMLRPVMLRRRGARIGRLVVLGKSRIVGSLRNLSIGDETSLGRCEIVLHDRIEIGNRVTINDGAILLSASHSLSDPQWRHKKRPIRVGDYAWIATGAIVLPGVEIGRGAVVGAGAVVRESVADHVVVAGNPAQPMRALRTKDLSYSPVLFNAPFEAWIGPEHVHGGVE